jgi:DDE_Tnp_1-associated
VPACSSSASAIPAVAHRLDAPAALLPDQCRDLLDYLAQIADPPHLRGRRHALTAVLAVAVAAVLAGARSLVAIGEWAADAPGPVLAALGVRRDPRRAVAVDGKTLRGSGHYAAPSTGSPRSTTPPPRSGHNRRRPHHQ